DYCPNGLQVEGRAEVGKLVTGVTASQQLLDAAIAQRADAILVHHGYFWKSEPICITGIKQQRLKKLLCNDISLLAYHLPLDLHATLGNNIQLAQLMGWPVEPSTGSLPPLVRSALLDRGWTGAEMAQHIQARLGRAPLHIDVARPIHRIAWCTGAAQSYLADAVELGADAFVSGEVSESTVHEAREHNIHYFAAGHHATERYGVKALGEHLASEFGLVCEFIDCPNPA
ncbi:MAG: Nif3-like dinuclear metal center hexameric protein, partial [Gammaproteobacteria bacterium]|nr:Nif3-like dinuclear metal center hexameric protein [Gammaproteobacteria bacterium]